VGPQNLKVDGRRLKAEVGLLACVLALGCGGTSTVVAPPPPPAAAPAAEVIEEPQPVVATLAEARALREAGDLAQYERGLHALSTSTDDVTRRRALSLLALFLFDQKRYDDAAPALETAAVENGAIGPFLRLRAIEAEASRGRTDNAISQAAQIIATAPATSAAAIARLRLPALYAQAGDGAAADAAVEQTTSVAIDELSEHEFFDLATLLAKWGRDDLAARVRMRLLTDYTRGRNTEAIYAAVTPEIDALPLDRAVKLAASLASADRYDQALDLLERIAVRFPDAATSDLYKPVRLRALFNSRNYGQLLAETAQTRLDDPALLLLRARAAWREDQSQTFLATLEQLEKRFPASREAIEAKVQRAKFYVTDEIGYEKSLANLKKAIDAGALGNEGENLWTLGWTYNLAGRYDEALQTFATYISSYPDGDYKTNSLFWTGKIHDRFGRQAERDAFLRQITIEYPYSYYAYRAREIMGVPTVAPAQIAGGAIFPNIDEQLAQVDPGRLAAVRELIEVDLVRDATRELKGLAAEFPDNSGIAFLLADTYVGAGEPFKANGVLQRRFRQFVRHGGENVPARFWQILFPLNFGDAIRAEADRRGLDPYLVASIIRQESGFEPTVVSNAGAVGLMQIMPQEAARIASLAGIEGITRERLFDPVENIAIGAAEYSQKLASMNGNHILAIAAYNAGAEAVGRWIAQTPIGDPDLFVESIPYAETRLYVKSVTRNRFEYRRIYESSTEVPQ
jgi:soluble lytic murein transglycosylase